MSAQPETRNSRLETRRILVTGGAGFICSHLCERLINEGHEVICHDNFFTGRRENILLLLDDGRVVSNFIVQALRGEQLTIYGEGDQTRSFCYVDDLVEGLIRLMNADALHDPVNLGNPGEFTIKQLAEEVMRMCGSNASVKYLPLPQDDPKQRQPNITRAEELLGWRPAIALREGLEKTVAYFRNRVMSDE